MTTYVYETIPQKRGEQTRNFVIKQSLRAKPLTKHPDTGEPIRRVMLGEFSTLNAKLASVNNPGCGPSCGCH